MLDLSVIANQHLVIMDIAENNLIHQESPQVKKYAIITLQFLLHSKTENQWNSEEET